MFIIFIPVYMFLILIPVRMVLHGQTEGYFRAAGTIHWGLMTTVFTLSHMAYPARPAAPRQAGAGGAGLVLFLVLVTQFNDVAQYIWGKLVRPPQGDADGEPEQDLRGAARRRSPRRFVLVASVLAPLPHAAHARRVAARRLLILPLAGFVGDVSISAIKRDLGVKDSGARASPATAASSTASTA